MIMSELMTKALRAKQSQIAQSNAQPLEELRTAARLARTGATPHALRDAISRTDRLNLIAEIKRVSFSQEPFRTEHQPAELALAYKQGGAAAISVLTEEEYYQGSLDDLKQALSVSAVPTLRRDIFLEPCQVYETALLGAAGLALLATTIEESQLSEIVRIAEGELGLDVIVEVHSTNAMLRARALGATLISVSNPNPSASQHSLDVLVEVARAAPKDVVLVSEYDRDTIKHFRGLHGLGYQAFLVGETLLRSDRPGETLRNFLQNLEALIQLNQ
jgi:indole-3-glycerol phosphate synthase